MKVDAFKCYMNSVMPILIFSFPARLRTDNVFLQNDLNFVPNLNRINLCLYPITFYIYKIFLIKFPRKLDGFRSIIVVLKNMSVY